jgi:hypothetical protein
MCVITLYHFVSWLQIMALIGNYGGIWISRNLLILAVQSQINGEDYLVYNVIQLISNQWPRLINCA